MGQTTILEEYYDEFSQDTGEIHQQTKRTVKKSKIEPTDEFIKVSKYLNTIFAFNNIPLKLVAISLIIAQRMQFKTNIVYLLKDDKIEIGDMLGLQRRINKNGDIDTNSVDRLIKECVNFNILRPIARGKYEVNSFLFSTGSIVETRQLQAHFDFDRDAFSVYAEQKNLINGATVRKAVMNKRDHQIPGQLTFLKGDNIVSEAGDNNA